MDRRSFMRITALGAALPSVPSLSGPARIRRAVADGSMVRIAAIQTRKNPKIRDLRTDPFREGFSQEDVNRSVSLWLDWYEELIGRAARESVKLAVLTEDFTRTSHLFMYLDDRSIFRKTVEKQTPLIAERLGATARRHSMYIVACYFAAEGDLIYNVADLFGPDGRLVGRYRKVHMPQYEMWQVTPGDSYPVFDTDIGRIGMLICYDQMWPEAAAACALNGAEIICHPSAAVLKEPYMIQRAHDGQVHYLSATGTSSMISSPKNELLANGGDADPAVVRADVDLKQATLADPCFYEYLYSGIRDHRERHLKYRRPETYGVLTEKRPPLADRYPEGGTASTPEAVRNVYSIVKKIRSGDPDVRGKYHWRW